LILFVVVEWHICDSGIFVINRDPQFFTFIVKAASVAFHGHVCVLHYQWRNGIYCINSLAICKEIALPRY
jgi:hypothetical protein